MEKINHKINRTKINAFTMALLMVLYIASLSMVYAGAGQSTDMGKISEIPGVPDDAVQYNKTDVMPVAQMEQVMAGEPALFCYRNTTMLMNCTRNCDIIFTADPVVTPKIFGLSIDPNQTMALTMNLNGSPLEGAQVMERTLNFYMGIELNATIQLKAQIRLYINQTEFSQQLNREVNASRLTWMYWNRTGREWVPVPSYMDQNGYLVCNTDHFSTWTVAEISESTEAGPDPETTLTNGVQMAYIYAGIATIIIIVLGVGLYSKSRRGNSPNSPFFI
jgi:hypothetical protein